MKLKQTKMKTIIDNVSIDLLKQEKITILMHENCFIDNLHYEIEFDPKYNGAALFIDVLDGKEKFISIIFDRTGIIKNPLNPSNFFETENFEVKKIIFNCYRKVEFNFTLKKSEIKKNFKKAQVD